MKKIIFVSIMFGASVSAVHANVASVNPRPRSLGMGGVGTALSGDAESASINPAALAEVEKGEIQPFPILIEVPFDIGALNSVLDFNDARDSKDTSVKQAALQKLLHDIGSKSLATRINIYPSYTRKNMHFGILADLYGQANFRVDGLTSNQLVELGNTSGTVGVVVGGAYSFLNKSLEVGATLKPLYRLAGTANTTQTVNDIVQGNNAGNSVGDALFGKSKFNNKGFGVGLDLGMKYFLPVSSRLAFLKPSIGVTYQDIADTRFTGDNNLPSRIPQSISAGFSIQPNWKFMRNTFSLDIRNITSNEVFMNKLHIGAETVIMNFLAIRAGLSQGYITAGIGLNLWLLKLDIFLAAREVGQYAHIDAVRTLGANIAFSF